MHTDRQAGIIGLLSPRHMPINELFRDVRVFLPNQRNQIQKPPLFFCLAAPSEPSDTWLQTGVWLAAGSHKPMTLEYNDEITAKHSPTIKLLSGIFPGLVPDAAAHSTVRNYICI